MLSARKKIYVYYMLLFGLMANLAYGSPWQKIKPGLEYCDLNPQSLSQWSHIHAFRIDLNQYELKIVLAKDLPQPYASAQTYHHYGQALIAINGGFFNPNKTPLGLRISNYQLLNPLRPISWWGIFSIKNHTASITSPYDFHSERNINFAIQTGPRLIISGRIPLLKTGFANRSALGITATGKVIMLVTENLPMTTTDLAKTMKQPPLNCIDALNLDGGSSSQLYAKIGHFRLDVPGFTQVSDAIIVKSL
ncbi:MAG TPA: phosphodiester glycosidase family protein [Legionellaceae bacterium]|nr:phosphodiester glycosidase family protein [Legionellaceae bacterium]